MDAQGFSAWLDAYGRAWEARDPDAAANLFAPDATYRVTPFRAPHEGRDAIRAYWERATSGQRGISFEHRVLATTSDHGIAWWRSAFDVAGSGRVTLDGIFVIAFAPDGQATSLREWWHQREEE